MRACFLGQNICALGFGVATLQTPPLLLDERTGEPMQNLRQNPLPGEASEKGGDNPSLPRPGLPPLIGIGPL
jgi:hypothetical protein